MTALALIATLALLAGAVAASGPADLDEVYCALCHYEEGDDFATSTHYHRGLLLCNDCHGGLPFESEEAVAKSPETGFIGKPSRQHVAGGCGSCHIAAADFLARGPHADAADPDNATCVSCHGNHRVQRAELTLMDSTCGACHAVGSAALETGREIGQQLEAGRSLVDRVRSELDSAAAAAPVLRREVARLGAAVASLRQADAMTHAWDREIIAARLAEFEVELGSVESRIREEDEERRRRGWIAGAVWLFVAANLILLWRQRKVLR